MSPQCHGILDLVLWTTEREKIFSSHVIGRLWYNKKRQNTFKRVRLMSGFVKNKHLILLVYRDVPRIIHYHRHYSRETHCDTFLSVQSLQGTPIVKRKVWWHTSHFFVGLKRWSPVTLHQWLRLPFFLYLQKLPQYQTWPVVWLRVDGDLSKGPLVEWSFLLGTGYGHWTGDSLPS